MQHNAGLAKGTAFLTFQEENDCSPCPVVSFITDCVCTRILNFKKMWCFSILSMDIKCLQNLEIRGFFFFFFFLEDSVLKMKNRVYFKGASFHWTSITSSPNFFQKNWDFHANRSVGMGNDCMLSFRFLRSRLTYFCKKKKKREYF